MDSMPHTDTHNSPRCCTARCEYSERDLSDFHIVLLHEDPKIKDVFPAAIMEMFECLSKVRGVGCDWTAGPPASGSAGCVLVAYSGLGGCAFCGHNQSEEGFTHGAPPTCRQQPLANESQKNTQEPPRSVNDPLFMDKAVVIGTSVAGIGPTCRGFPWCRPRYNRQPPVPHMMLTWKARMMKCMGLPTDLVAKTERPYLLFINRPLDTGRGFLNLDKIVTHVRVRAGSRVQGELPHPLSTVPPPAPHAHAHGVDAALVAVARADQPPAV